MMTATMSVEFTGVEQQGYVTKVEDTPKLVARAEADDIQIIFKIPRGLGQSQFWIHATSDNFAMLAEAMMEANPNAAIKAFGAALFNFGGKCLPAQDVGG